MCETKAEAESWLASELDRMDRGEVLRVDYKRQSLAAFLTEFYTVHRKCTRGNGVLSAATCAADVELLNLYVLRRSPGLAATPLRNLTVDALRSHFKTLSDSGLAFATVSRVHRTLRARLAFALAEGRIRFNPMADARIPVAGRQKRVRRILTGEQVAALLSVCDESKIGTFIATLIWTGVRPGEAAGLTWDSVDLEARTMHVRSSLVRTPPTADQKGSGVSWALGPTKTGTERVVPLPDALVAMLRRHRAQQAGAKLLAGPEYSNNELVFASDFGKPVHLDTMATRYFKPLLRRAAVHLAGQASISLPPPSRAIAYGEAVTAYRALEDEAVKATSFPMVSLYELRHLFGSRLSANGVPVKDIQNLMGHANALTTLNSYIHTNLETQRKALDSLEHAYRFGGLRSA